MDTNYRSSIKSNERNEGIKTCNKNSSVTNQATSFLKNSVGNRFGETEDRQKLENRKRLGDKEWMNAYEAADYIGVSYGGLRNMAYRREIPFFKMGRRLRFRTDDIRQHLIQNQVGIREWKPCR